MSKGLDYFKSVYKDVPAWVQIMNDYDSTMLDAYTEIRGQAFKTNYLKDTEKDEIIAAVNAGRLYERSMTLHTMAGINKGSKVTDFVEYFLVAYVYNGLNSLVLSLNAIQHYIKSVFDKDVVIQDYDNLIEVINDLIVWLDDESDFLIKVREQLITSKNADQTRDILMQAGYVSVKRKQLCLIGMYLTELDGEGAKEEILKAREMKVSEAEMADLGYIIILTAGIPSWFELSDHLEKKEG